MQLGSVGRFSAAESFSPVSTRSLIALSLSSSLSLPLFSL